MTKEPHFHAVDSAQVFGQLSVICQLAVSKFIWISAKDVIVQCVDFARQRKVFFRELRGGIVAHHDRDIGRVQVVSAVVELSYKSYDQKQEYGYMWMISR